MNKLKHTPGPWGIDTKQTAVVRLSEYIRVEQIFEVDNFPRFISENEIIVEGDANAKLIEAAPDMLRTLIEIEKCLANAHERNYERELIRKMIHKATS